MVQVLDCGKCLLDVTKLLCELGLHASVSLKYDEPTCGTPASTASCLSNISARISPSSSRSLITLLRISSCSSADRLESRNCSLENARVSKESEYLTRSY